ncbi:Sec-independent protein translocase subunit TatA [Corynebacterium aquatimens]|uniref:Sec-independent protein translocase subunit TatA n=1 Tax=Corynebacterium TaxID=1716 RepID=UPI001F289626|nr:MULTISPECIES: Sec-independent protein translocase subunit TatA [Corynebacterium]QYH19744.1 Sec-independent protein translocase subunit TatA [Corynebacterium aquatimens]UIZ93142.1 Sec-independent protein translocase subunit TatA [Corynebacterium sp. CNCTC7651]
MPSVGLPEILIILAIVLLLFGANKLPDLARSMGRSARIFKSEVKEMRREDMEDPVTQPGQQQIAAQPSQYPAQPNNPNDVANPGYPVNPANQETRSAAQPDDFWDRPENQPRR